MVGGACGLLPGLGWVGRAVRGRGCSEGDMRIGRDWERVGGEGRGEGCEYIIVGNHYCTFMNFVWFFNKADNKGDDNKGGDNKGGC